MSIYYDETLSRAETLRYLNRWREKIGKLKKSTHFNREELEKLFLVHLKITMACGPINTFIFREVCHTVLGITDDDHYEKMYGIFDPKLVSYITPDSWAENLSIMLRGSLPEQINFVWQVYSHDNYITRDMMSAYLKKTIIKKKGDAGYDSMVKDLVSLLLKKLDLDLDGRVSHEDFRKSVLDNPLLLECLGPCLPSPQAAAAFASTFSGKAVRVRVLAQISSPGPRWHQQGRRHIAFRGVARDQNDGSGPTFKKGQITSASLKQ